jgi:xanthine dehydrogenase YagS FAD-binding subunit
MKDFRHVNATSLDQALSLLKEFNGRAKLNAGGTDLMGVLKSDILPDYPEAIINIKGIPDLDNIREDDYRLSIGPLTKLTDIVESPVIKKKYHIVSEAADSVASPEIRNVGTIGGNLCQDSRCWYYRYPHSMGGRIHCFRKGKGPCMAIKGDNRYHAIFGGKKCFSVCPSDMAVALAALDARIKVINQKGERVIPVFNFYVAMGNALKPDEILTEIQVPRLSRDTVYTFSKFRVKDSVDFAIASVASAINIQDGICRDARIVLGAVAPTPYRATEAEDAIRGKRLDKALAEDAGDAAVTKANPLSMNSYKVDITKTLVKRAILASAHSEMNK